LRKEFKEEQNKSKGSRKKEMTNMNSENKEVESQHNLVVLFEFSLTIKLNVAMLISANFYITL
jgi:hypothetical protein